jgi:hypothetical protein
VPVGMQGVWLQGQFQPGTARQSLVTNSAYCLQALSRKSPQFCLGLCSRVHPCVTKGKDFALFDVSEVILPSTTRANTLRIVIIFQLDRLLHWILLELRYKAKGLRHGVARRFLAAMQQGLVSDGTGEGLCQVR